MGIRVVIRALLRFGREPVMKLPGCIGTPSWRTSEITNWDWCEMDRSEPSRRVGLVCEAHLHSEYWWANTRSGTTVFGNTAFASYLDLVRPLYFVEREVVKQPVLKKKTEPRIAIFFLYLV